jgi:hypothetical protein
MIMPNFFQSLTHLFRPKKLGSTSLDWWVEIKTAQPICIYYFGPFYHRHEAIAHHPGYVEDLAAEGAQDIQIAITRGQPQHLTICNE